jgi:5-methylcytosine-specific restriction endonuclease McrA
MMNKRVLVLNQDFSPVSICTIQRAFLLVYLEKAYLVSRANGSMIRTVSFAYPMPSVIRLKNYVHIPYRGVVLTRQNIFKRDGFRCQYCGTSGDLTLDHVVPKARGGKTTWANLVTACKSCNARKGDYTPEELGLTIRTRPFRPSYVMFLRDYSGYAYEEWIPYLKTGTSDW